MLFTMLVCVQRPGGRVAVWGLWRRVVLFAACGVVGLRWGADDSRLCVCLRWHPALVPACFCRPSTASLCNNIRCWCVLVCQQEADH